MPAGRPRKSDAEKAARGTLQPCRLRANRSVMAVNGELNPEPPTGLTSEARTAWEMAVSCAPKGVLTALDHGALERWARNYAIYRKLQREVDSAGAVDPDDPSKTTAAFNALMKIQAVMLPIEKELGFTPASRPRVRAPEAEEEEKNPFIDG